MSRQQTSASLDRHACADQAVLVAHGMVLASTQQWNALDPMEAALLVHLLPAINPTGMSDVPIYLPISSPTTPVRLLVTELSSGKSPRPQLHDTWNCSFVPYGSHRLLLLILPWQLHLMGSQLPIHGSCISTLSVTFWLPFASSCVW